MCAAALENAEQPHSNGLPSDASEGPVQLESLCMECRENVSLQPYAAVCSIHLQPSRSWWSAHTQSLQSPPAALQGTTTILLTEVPHFRELAVYSFECQHCGNRHAWLLNAPVHRVLTG